MKHVNEVDITAICSSCVGHTRPGSTTLHIAPRTYIALYHEDVLVVVAEVELNFLVYFVQSVGSHRCLLIAPVFQFLLINHPISYKTTH